MSVIGSADCRRRRSQISPVVERRAKSGTEHAWNAGYAGTKVRQRGPQLCYAIRLRHSIRKRGSEVGRRSSRSPGSGVRAHSRASRPRLAARNSNVERWQWRARGNRRARQSLPADPFRDLPSPPTTATTAAGVALRALAKVAVHNHAGRFLPRGDVAMTLAVRVVVIRVIVVVAHVQQVEIVARPLVSHARTTDRLRTGRTAASAASFATTAAAPTTSARLFFGAGIARFARVGIVIQFQEVIFPIVFHFVRQAFFATGILRAAARTTAIAAVIRPAVAVSAAAAFATPALAAAMLPTTPATPTTLRFTLSPPSSSPAASSVERCEASWSENSSA